jgi:hypothetical protein
MLTTTPWKPLSLPRSYDTWNPRQPREIYETLEEQWAARPAVTAYLARCRVSEGEGQGEESMQLFLPRES